MKIFRLHVPLLEFGFFQRKIRERKKNEARKVVDIFRNASIMLHVNFERNWTLKHEERTPSY